MADVLVAATSMVESQPESWDVPVVDEPEPGRREDYATVERSRFLDLLARWWEVVARARELGQPVACSGD